MSDEQRKERRELRLLAFGVLFFAGASGAVLLLGVLLIPASMILAVTSIVCGWSLGTGRAYYEHKWDR